MAQAAKKTGKKKTVKKAAKKTAKKKPVNKATVTKTAGKKTTSKKTVRKADNKTKPTRKSVTAYINAVDHETRRRDAKTALALFKKVTGEKPEMWGGSIIGFGRYIYRYESGREGEWLNVGFSPRKAQMVMYVMGSIPPDDPLRTKLGKYKTGRGCLYVNKFEDIDLKILEKIVRKSFTRTLKKYGAA